MVCFQEVIVLLDISMRTFFNILFLLITEIPRESILYKGAEHFSLSETPQGLPVPADGHVLELLRRAAVGGGTVYPSTRRCWAWVALRGIQNWPNWGFMLH